MTFLAQHSSETMNTGQKDASPAVNYWKGNEYMVDHADCLREVCDNDCSIRSGTRMTANYVRKRGTVYRPDPPEQGNHIERKT